MCSTAVTGYISIIQAEFPLLMVCATCTALSLGFTGTQKRKSQAETHSLLLHAAAAAAVGFCWMSTARKWTSASEKRMATRPCMEQASKAELTLLRC
jgi:hypothetical protein